MSDQDIGSKDNLATDATDVNQANTAKTYTQEEFDRHMAGLKNSIAKKYEKQFSELGDIDELRQLKTEAEKRRHEESVKKGEFEKILKELADKKDAEIARRDHMITEFKIEMPLIQAASQFKSVNPEQVKSLLRNNIRLNNGDVEVIDESGQVRYSDKGTAFTTQDLVKEFLDKNPHFVQATPATTMSQNSVNSGKSSKLDISSLDMTKPEHRKIYAEYRKTNGFA